MRVRLCLLALLTGCATASNFQRADTMGKGTWALGADISAMGVVDSGDWVATVPVPRVSARAGVHDNVDLGGTVGIDGIRGQAKIQVLETETVVLSLAPGLRYLPLPEKRHLAGLEEVVLLGINASDQVQFVATLKAEQDIGIVDGEVTGVIPWGGGSMGVSIRVGRYVRLMPEIGAMVPLLVIDQSGDLELPKGVLPQAGLGFNYRF